MKAAFKGIKGSRDNIGLAIDSSAAILREHSLPFSEEERIRQVIKFEIEGKLPQMSIDDVVVDYYVIDETSNGVKLLVTAVPKDELGTVLDLASAADCDPQVADISAFALFNAAAAAGRIADQGTTVLFHVEDDSCLLLVAEHGTLRVVRSLKGGVLTLKRSLGKALGKSPDELPDLSPYPGGDEEFVLLDDGDVEPGSIEQSEEEVSHSLAVRHHGGLREADRTRPAPDHPPVAPASLARGSALGALLGGVRSREMPSGKSSVRNRRRSTSSSSWNTRSRTRTSVTKCPITPSWPSGWRRACSARTSSVATCARKT